MGVILVQVSVQPIKDISQQTRDEVCGIEYFVVILQKILHIVLYSNSNQGI